MATIDAFRQDPFSMISLTEAVERNPFRPSGIGALGVFEANPIRTVALAVERRAGVLTLIQTSPRGAPAVERTTEQRTAQYFPTPRLRHGDTIRADEIQGVREFGSETEVMQLQTEVARRLMGPTGLLSNIEYTWEHMRLAAVQGSLIDADGTLIWNWFDQFAITAAAEVAFNLPAKTAGSLRPAVHGIIRAMARAAQGAYTSTTQVVGICGDTFWDELTTHPDVEKTFLNWQQAVELRKGIGFGLGPQGGIAEGMFDAMNFAGVDWFNYRGSDDTTTLGIATDKVKFFPRNAPGVFKVAYAPAENFTYVNTPGKPQYVQPIFDIQRNEWWRMEVSSYPLFICTRPEVLQSGRAGT
jgi:hypothetical protein